MDESEYALRNIADSVSPRASRIVNTLLQDSRHYKLWESRHADLLVSVAGQSNKKRQIMALRNVEVQLIHRRALFEYLRANAVRGERRRRLFRMFHSTLDFQDSVLAEHRQYMLAVSSRISTDHLIDLMHDPGSKRLLRQYEQPYTRYYEMKCFVAGMGKSDCTELVRSMMGNVREQLRQARRRLKSEPPDIDCASFDRQEKLARSGRYPVLNYMVG